MRMAKQLEVFNLALNPALHVATDEFLPRNNLESDLLAGAAMHGQLDLAEAALAEGLDDVVCADALLCAYLVADRGLGPVVGGHAHDGGIHGIGVVAAGAAVAVSSGAADLGGG